MARFTNKILRDDAKEVIVNLSWQSEINISSQSNSPEIAQDLVNALDVSALEKNTNGDECKAVSIQKGWFSTHFINQNTSTYSDNYHAAYITDSLNNIILALDYGHDNVIDWTPIGGLPNSKEFAKVGENPNGDLKIACGSVFLKSGNARSVINSNTRLNAGSSYNITLQCSKLYV